MTDVVHKRFGEPFFQQLIREFEFNKTSSMLPLMNVIGYMSGLVLFERSQNIGPRVIMNQ
jgi:hypothetical protein